jgi:hypothetical protein
LLHPRAHRADARPLPACPHAPSSDDVDDQHTERGRALLRKEMEAAANGLRIGDVLHSDVIDLEFPGLGPKKSERPRGCTMAARSMTPQPD